MRENPLLLGHFTLGYYAGGVSAFTTNFRFQSNNNQICVFTGGESVREKFCHLSKGNIAHYHHAQELIEPVPSLLNRVGHTSTQLRSMKPLRGSRPILTIQNLSRCKNNRSVRISKSNGRMKDVLHLKPPTFLHKSY